MTDMGKFKNLLSTFQAAQKLHCSEGTLANWRSQEKGPNFTKMPNGRVYYPEDAIHHYLKECLDAHQSANSKLISYSELFQTHKIALPNLEV